MTGSTNVTWVYVMLGIYIIYCFYWGLRGYFTEKTSSGYSIAGRSIPFIAFLMAASAASFSGWTFIGHPGLIWRDGMAYAFASFYVLTIPITGAFFSKRTWLLGKRYGFVTPGDMYAYYFNNEAIRWLVVLTAVLYSVFYSAVQLKAAGALFEVITGVPLSYGAIFLACIVWFYVCTGGLKASTWVGVIQFILLVGGIVLLGFFVIKSPLFEGWTNFSNQVKKIDATAKMSNQVIADMKYEIAAVLKASDFEGLDITQEADAAKYEKAKKAAIPGLIAKYNASVKSVGMTPKADYDAATSISMIFDEYYAKRASLIGFDEAKMADLKKGEAEKASKKSLLKVPKLINFGLGGGWTAMMILTYMFALMGIQSSPAFTMWTFGIKSPKPLAWQQAFMSTFVVGFALFFFTAFQGMGAKILQNLTVLGQANDYASFWIMTDKDVVPLLMKNFLSPFVLGIVFIGAIAAIHSTAAPYIGTGGSILLRDVYWRYVKKQNVGDAEQIMVNRIFATILTVLALGVGLTSPAALVILGALATAFGFVMYVLLLGVIWGFRFPSMGAVLGVIAGMLGVYLTYNAGPFPNLLSMHSAFWGVFLGLTVAYICKGIGIKDSPETVERQAEVRQWLDDVDAPSESGRKWRSAMKIVVPVWYFFAIGPAVYFIANNFMSISKFPSLWSWQIVWWILGIVMMWALCFKAEMATTNETQIKRADEEQNLVVQE